MSADRALALLERAGASDEPLLVPLDLDAATLREQAREGTLPAILRGLVRAPAKARREQRSLASRLAGVAEEERAGLVLEIVRSQIAVVLGHGSAEEIEPDRAFQDLGFDSLTAVELRNRLGAATGLRLAPTLAFDYPSPAALAGYLAGQVGDGGASGEEEVDRALAGLEEKLELVGKDPRASERVSERLRAALAVLAGSAEPEAGTGGESLASMSNDEVFALIDEELSDD